MRSQDILDATGMVDDECVQNAKPKRKSYKGLFVTVVSFAAWREKNGIGDEVELIEYRSDSSGGYSTTLEFQGQEYIKYTLPDYFILNITVSANLENYYDKVDSELLLESLKQTLTAYMNIEYDEYHITFE